MSADRLNDYLDGKLSTTDGKFPKSFDGHAPDPTLDFSGQHKAYWILSASERAKGFVRPLRSAYKHSRCGGVTTMARPLAETYAADPCSYHETFCIGCCAHFPVREFMWMEMDGSYKETVGS
jgi:hypothetical protein